MTRYVALYCRISKDRNGRVEGVKAQTKWGQDYATSAWPGVPVKVFADNNLSAADEDVYRPGYEELREAVGRGEVLHLWSVEQSRLERTEVGWFKLAAELDAAGITELHTNRDGIVRVRDEVAGIKAVLAAGEVRKLKKRVNDRLDAIAAEGRPAGATVYGYRRGVDENGGKTLLLVEEQAVVIREAAERVLAGWSLARIAADLDARGVTGAHGGKITGHTVKGMLTNPTIAGLRVHRGRMSGRGIWSPILDESTWYAVRDKLSSPRVVKRADGFTYPLTGAPRVTGRRYLLTGGTAVCGVCEHPLVASMKQLKGGTVKPYYLCHPKTGGKGCIGIMGDRFEEHVITTLLDELDKPEFREALAQDEHEARRDEITTALRTLDGKRKVLAEQWSADELTDEEWRTARRALAEREQELRAELAAVPPPTTNVDLDLLREAWPVMNLDERREVIGMFIAQVVVKRATPGTKGFDPRRVAIEWR